MDAEAQLAGFTELVGTALANAEARAQLIASRARIVAAADAARQRIERDLHDGAQQRLVCLALELRAARAVVPPEAGELAALLDGLADEATGAQHELRELARGIHPGVLAHGGLTPALAAAADRSVVPVVLDVRVDRQLPKQTEIAAYYLVSEALTNAAKHAQASVVHIKVNTAEGAPGRDVLRVAVRDDGAGGAEFTGGTGLVGIKDRVEALGGSIEIESARGKGTALRATLPIFDSSGNPSLDQRGIAQQVGAAWSVCGDEPAAEQRAEQGTRQRGRRGKQGESGHARGGKAEEDDVDGHEQAAESEHAYRVHDPGGSRHRQQWRNRAVHRPAEQRAVPARRSGG